MAGFWSTHPEASFFSHSLRFQCMNLPTSLITTVWLWCVSLPWTELPSAFLRARCLLARTTERVFPYDWNIIYWRNNLLFLQVRVLDILSSPGFPRQGFNAFCSSLSPNFQEGRVCEHPECLFCARHPLDNISGQGSPWPGVQTHSYSLSSEAHLSLWCGPLGASVFQACQQSGEESEVHKNQGKKDGKQNRKVPWQFSVRGNCCYEGSHSLTKPCACVHQ